MSASSPPSVMLRAATATSGGTRAAVDVLLDLALDRRHEGLDLDARLLRVFDELDPRLEVRISLDEVEQPDAPLPWTMARMVPSWSRMTWAILASVPTVYSSSTVPISSASAERWAMSATGARSPDGAVEGLHAAVTADLRAARSSRGR